MGRSVEEIIQNCQLFAEVDPVRCRKLAEISRVCQFAKQQMVFRQGQDCPGVFIVDTGIGAGLQDVSVRQGARPAHGGAGPDVCRGGRDREFRLPGTCGGGRSRPAAC